ncbi:hemolysin-III related-domain-containing protein [Globomyces pollinis-pini]|nr:hemolysin-III related-domain-containing protein [Globomyces pollinis-pini]
MRQSNSNNPDGPILESFQDYEPYENHPTNSINNYTVHVNLMPEWYIKHPFIDGGYRRITYSIRGCLISLFYLHNELGNIYSHMIGMFMYLGFLPYASIWLSHPTTSTFEYILFYASCLSSFVCFATSTLFHTCCCHSKRVSIFCNKADFTGIVFVLLGSLVPTVYYAFYCQPFLRQIYISAMLILGVITLNVTTSSRFSGPHFRTLRTCLFAGLPFSAIIPVCHHIYIVGTDLAIHTISLHSMGKSAVISLVGVFIFVRRIPERYFPNQFNIFGHSHQFWHICVILGITVQFFGYLDAYQWWHLNNPTCQLSTIDLIKSFS